MATTTKKLRFIITGAGGQVGTALSEHLASLDVDHVALSRSELDITSPGQVREVLCRQRPDVVFNCAAYNAVDKAESEGELAYAVNRDGPAHLAAVCEEIDSVLVHYSTDYVFDGTQSGAYAEDAAPNPLSLYGSSKLAGEQAVLQSGAVHLVMRVSWVFGRIGQSFVDSVLGWASNGALNIAWDQYSVPCDAVALASASVGAAMRLLEEPGLGGLYHYAMSNPVTRVQYAEAILDTAIRHGIARPVQVTPVPGDYFSPAAERPANSALDGRNFEARFGIDPGSWQEGLNDYLETLKQREAAAPLARST